jgi:SAM-dependent methyltransferase
LDLYRETNRSLWAGWTRIHEQSRFYDVAGFRAGGTSLNPVELEEVGDVRGRSLLHLQCHFGLDTLSWARLGAQATGIDFSPEAVDVARRIAAELCIAADFVCSDVFDVATTVQGTFDIVFTSYGVIPWLPDLDAWAQVVAAKVRPGGRFHMVEFHPLVYALDTDGRTLKHDYVLSSGPIHYVEQGSYAEPEANFSHACYIWSHGLGEVVTALIGAGLRMDFLREHPLSPYGSFPFLTQRADGQWSIGGSVPGLPLLFSLGATRV